MKYFQFILVIILGLFISCMGLDKTVATIQGKKIHLSDIYQVYDKTVFNALAPAKKTAFVRKYAVLKYLSSSDKQYLTGMDFNVDEEKNKFEHDLIIQEVEKYLFNDFHFSDSTLEFVGDALNVDVYVKALTVSHKFSFGQANERTRDEAYKRANMIYNRIFSEDLSFEEAMSIYGELDVSKIKGNDMGQISFGFMPKLFNDLVWTSPSGKLIGPVETPIGYHVVIVDRKIPKFGNDKIEFDPEKIMNDLKLGRYNYQAENFQHFIDELYKTYAVSIDQQSLYKAWDTVRKIDGVNTMSGIAVDQMVKANFGSLLGSVGHEKITLNWVIQISGIFNFYNTATINSGFSFEKIINDVIARYLLLKWYEDNTNLFSGVDLIIKQKTVNKIYAMFLDRKQELTPDLTRDVIMNRIMLENEIVINSTLFTEDME